MKSKLYTYIIVVFLFSLFLMSKASIGVNIDTSTSSIKVDKLTIDIVQKADINTFKIDQFYYINNTGDDFFNDSFYIWVPAFIYYSHASLAQSPNNLITPYFFYINEVFQKLRVYRAKVFISPKKFQF